MAHFVGGPLDGLTVTAAQVAYPFVHAVEEVYPAVTYPMVAPPGTRMVTERGILRANTDGGYDTYEHTRFLRKRIYDRETQPDGDVRYLVRPIEQERG